MRLPVNEPSNVAGRTPKTKPKPPTKNKDPNIASTADLDPSLKIADVAASSTKKAV
jgi:hypothetical protein